MASGIKSQDECDHIKKKLVSESSKECIDCGKQFCTHPRIGFDSTCEVCGDYITEISTEVAWSECTYVKGAICTIVKNTKDHAKNLESLGYSQDFIEQVLSKFSSISCSLSEENMIVAACVWLTLWETGVPHTLLEVGKKHKLTKRKIKEGHRMVLENERFKEYRTKYITVPMMIRKVMLSLELDKSDDFEKHYTAVYEAAKFVGDNWDRLATTKRSAPQNIAAACVYIYVVHSPTFGHMVDTLTKKKQICKMMGPSYITVDKLAKQIEKELITVVDD